MHEVIREIADNDRTYDPWGAGMGALGAVCDVLWVEGGSIPAEAGYRPALALTRAALTRDACGEFDDQRTLLAGLDPDEFPGFWVDGYDPGLSLDDLEHAARVLSRYLDVVKIAGRDY